MTNVTIVHFGHYGDNLSPLSLVFSLSHIDDFVGPIPTRLPVKVIMLIFFSDKATYSIAVDALTVLPNVYVRSTG